MQHHWRGCNTAKVLQYVFLLLRGNHDFGVTVTLPSVCASLTKLLTKAMVH